MLSSITSGLLVHDVCEELMSRLEAKGWNVPGITLVREPAIELNNWKSYVSSVCGENFQIEFGQWQGEPFLLRLAVPCQEVNFWPTNRSLSMNVYAYTDWERDKEWFLREPHKYHGREHGAIRYLPYKSQCDCEKLDGAIFEGIGPLVDFMRGTGDLPPRNTLHSHDDGWKCPLMIFSDHYKTEYEPVDGEPRMFRTDEALEEMRQWLTTQLLPTL